MLTPRRLVLTGTVRLDGRWHGPGRTVDVPEAEARVLIDRGLAREPAPRKKKSAPAGDADKTGFGAS